METSSSPASSFRNREVDASLPEFKIKVLLIDDQVIIGETVRRMLASESDIELYFCSDPKMALAKANEIKPTIILQDLVMPDVDGMTLVRFFRRNKVTVDVPMIVLSSKEEPKTKAEAFANGANDYLVKLPDKVELVARIRHHSKGYINLLERNAAHEALLESQKALKAELDEAERYVRSLLPERLDNEKLWTNGIFESSTSLGGDAYGYHWLDDDHFAIYLLDVCGHGVGAALLSVTALTTLREETLRSVDFRKPEEVLFAMNNTFDMDRHNQMYFTLWYGVYKASTRELTFSSGGHPPAILITPDKKTTRLQTKGMVIGGMPGLPYEAASVQVPEGSYLYVFSDGVYELTLAEPKGEKTMLDLEDLEAEMVRLGAEDEQHLPQILAFAQKMQGNEKFEDDFSIFEVKFR